MPRLKAPDIEVTATPAPRDATLIPKNVVEHFSAKNLRLSWASRHDTQVTKAWVSYRYPVNLTNDVTNEETRKALGLVLTREGCRLNPDGTVQRADCYLYAQSQEAFEADERASNEMFNRHNSNVEREEFIATMNDKINQQAPGLARLYIKDSR